MATTDEAIGVYDSNDCLVAFNASYANVREAIGGTVAHGVSWDDLVTASVAAGKIPEALGREQEWLEQRKKMRGSYSVIRQIPDGRWFQVNERKIPNGGVAVVWTDISRLYEEMDRHRQTAEELRLLKVSLEQRVEERTTELQKAVVQRDLLLREVYHRVKNNLQVVDSLINMELRRIEDQPARDALTNVRARIRTLGLVHAQLMASDDLTTFDIGSFLHELNDNLSRTFRGRNTRLSLQHVAVQVTMDFALPLGLIITELVTNSVKYARPVSGETVVSLVFDHDGKDGFCLTIADNGSEPEAPARILSSSSVGGTIVRGLLAQMNATMKSTYDGGTRIVIRLPREEI